MGDRKRILVVDDEDQNLYLLEAFLESFGYDAELARDGFEALSKLSPEIDLVLLDIMMPAMDGFEVARRIRHDQQCGDTPVIMVTSLAGREDRIAAVEAGANDFITKPIDKVELRVRMNSLLRMKEVQDAIKRHRSELEGMVQRRTIDLRDTEERYRSLFEASHDAIIILSREGKIVDVNQAFLRLCGFSRDEALALDLREVYVDPADRGRFIEAIGEKGCISNREWKVRTRDGSERDCVFTAAVRRNADGAMIGYQSIIHDITDRKTAEEALRRSETRYRLLVENATEAVIVIQDGLVKFANPTATEIFGYSFDELISRPFEEFVHADDRAAFAEITATVLDGDGPSEHYGVRIIAGGGREKWLEWRSVRVPWEQSPAVLNFATDFTSRKLAEDALRESEKRFRAVFEAAQDSIFLKDHELRYTYVNPAMMLTLEVSSEQLVGKTDQEVFGAESVRGLVRIERRVLDGQSIEAEHTLVLERGPVTFNAVRVPMRNPSGEVTGLCGIARDVSERRQRPREPESKLDEFPSEAMRNALSQTKLAVGTDSIVLFVGEAGTGKRHFAHYVHDRSRRSNGPFLMMNCAGPGQDKNELELFGHESDLASDRPRRKRGLLELAEGGTLMVADVEGLSLDLQDKLLQFLDSQTFTVPGSGRRVAVNARVLAATSRDLSREVERGGFQKELFYRLDVFPIQVPPLRERRDDIPLLVRDLLASLATGLALPQIPELAPEALDILSAYHWPGNVRELRNVLERGLLLCNGTRLGADEILGTPCTGLR